MEVSGVYNIYAQPFFSGHCGSDEISHTTGTTPTCAQTPPPDERAAGAEALPTISCAITNTLHAPHTKYSVFKPYLAHARMRGDFYATINL